MPVTKSLTEMKRAFEYEGSLVIGTDDDDRHPVDDVEAEINSSYAEFIELLVERGFNHALTEGAQTAFPSSRADTNENYSLIDWPATALCIVRIDVYKGGTWGDPLIETDWENIRNVTPLRGSSSCRMPTHYAVKTYGTVSTTSQSAGKIALAPFATGGVYKLSYVSNWAAITDDTYLFIFPSETGFRWTIWNAIARAMARDGDRQKRYDISVAERDRCEARIGRFIPQATTSQGGQMRRGRSYRG